MLDKDQFGEKLLALRSKFGLSQNRLAQMLSVTYQAVSKWENGQSLPDIDMLPLIADVFGVTADYLLNRGIDGYNDCTENIIQAYELNEDKSCMLSVLKNTLPRDDFYNIAKMLENGELDCRLNVEFTTKFNNKMEVYSKEVPYLKLDTAALQSLSPVLSQLASQILNKRNNTIKRILYIIRCPKCNSELTFEKIDGIGDEFLECRHGHKLRIIDGVADFGTMEQKGNNWSNHYRSYSDYKKVITEIKTIYAKEYSKTTSALEKLIEKIKDTRPGYLLEVGCGMGSFADALIPHINWPCTMILTDISHRILRYVKRYFDESKFNPMLKIVYLACDARGLPIADDRIDAVASFGGFENMMENYRSGIQEAYRVLKNSGYCLYEMSMVDDTKSELVQKWIKLMENSNDPDFELILPIIKSKEDWNAINREIGFSECTIDKLVDEYPAPDVDEFPYNNEVTRWMGEAVIAARK